MEPLITTFSTSEEALAAFDSFGSEHVLACQGRTDKFPMAKCCSTGLVSYFCNNGLWILGQACRVRMRSYGGETGRDQVRRVFIMSSCRVVSLTRLSTRSLALLKWTNEHQKPSFQRRKQQYDRMCSANFKLSSLLHTSRLRSIDR